MSYCKDCPNWDENGIIPHYCRALGWSPTENDFCSFEDKKPERSKGKWEWIDTETIELSYGVTGYIPVFKCSCCNRLIESYVRTDKPIDEDIDFPNFCPECGADMREE